MLALGREAMVRAPPPMRDSAASPCFHGCLAFLHRHFPTRSPSHPLDLSLRSQQHPLLWDCSTISKPQLPAIDPSRGPAFLDMYGVSYWGYVRGMYGCSKDCLILIPFRLPEISCFPPSLKCFSSDSDNCLYIRIGPLLQFPDPRRASPVLLTLLFFPLVPSSY